MVFNSFKFLIFFIIVYSLYWVIPKKYRNYMLLIASYVFYMAWEIKYIVLILTSTIVDYLCGLGMEKYKDDKKRRLLLVISLVTNLGILFSFKYWNFFGQSISNFSGFFGLNLHWVDFNVLLPVGISFYTFQTLSYTIDVYRRKISAERHLPTFALYVSFFPQLVAGPIERASNLLPQFNKKRDPKLKEILYGFKLVMLGYFKKMVVADNLAMYVDKVYNVGFEGSGYVYLLATYAFAFQIYCDFSGYSNIAIGIAKMMGFNFMQNFDRPYFSKTITEFWRRWHISLSSWLKDYLYISLGGNRKGKIKTYRNLMVTMVLGGLWHGANWTFVFWGFLNGMYLISSKLTINFRNELIKKVKLPKPLVKVIRMFITFHLVCITWIYFRAKTIGQANYILKTIISGITDFEFLDLLSKVSNFDYFLVGGFFALILLIIDYWLRKGNIIDRLNQIPMLVRYLIYSALIFAILIFGVFETNQFIYFQF